MLQQFKCKYDIVQALLNNGDFGYVLVRILPTAPDDVWTKYLAILFILLFLRDIFLTEFCLTQK
jgi:hypothetical protein